MKVAPMGVSVVKDTVTKQEVYTIFCPRPKCGFVFESFQDTHICPYYDVEIDVDGNVITKEII